MDFYFSIFILFSLVFGKKEKLETLCEEDAMSEDAESQSENEVSLRVPDQNEAASQHLDANKNKRLEPRGKRSLVRQDSRTNVMKNAKNFQRSHSRSNSRSNSESRDTGDNDPRKSHDLKQKVRKVRFFLPLSSSFVGRKKLGRSTPGGQSGRNSSHSSDTNSSGSSVVTQARHLTTTKRDQHSMRETKTSGTIPDDPDNSDGEEEGGGSTAESVSEYSMTSSRSSKGQPSPRPAPSSGNHYKVRWRLHF